MPVTTLPDLPARLAPALLVAALLLSTTVGCSPTPSPPPTPTPTPLFATEEEAFAAAEDVYREYNEAGNSGTDTTEFLTDAALESELETFRYLDENELQLEGAGSIKTFTATSSASVGASTIVEALVCLDVSAVVVRNSNGEDVTPTDRPDTFALSVSFASVGHRLLITDSQLDEDGSC